MTDLTIIFTGLIAIAGVGSLFAIPCIIAYEFITKTGTFTEV